MKKKRIYWGFYSLDYKSTEEYLEQMALKGWMLEKIGKTIATFKKIEPQSLRYHVDIFEGGGPFKSENSIEAKEYRKKFENQGWNYITSQDYLQFFYSIDGNKEAIKTEDKLEKQKIESKLWNMEIINLIFVGAISIYVLSKLFPISITTLVTSLGLAVTFLFPLVFLAFFISFIYGITRIYQNKKDVNEGRCIEIPTLENAKKRRFWFNIVPWFVAIIFFISAILDSYFMLDTVLLAFLPVFSGMTIGFFLRYFIKKSKNENSIIYISIAILLIGITVVAIHNFTPEQQIASIDVDYKADRYPFVTLNEFTDEKNEATTKEFNHSMSFIVPKHYKYKEISESDAINIRYYEALNPYFAEVIFRTSVDEIKRGIRWRGTYLFSRDVREDYDKKEFWEADNLAYEEQFNELILHKGDKVIHISGSIDFDDKEAKEIINNTFFYVN